MDVLYIVVPCYNEEKCLPRTAPVFRTKLMELMDSGKIALQSRILLVSDGSTDGTWNIIRALHEGDEHFLGLSLYPNRGHQNAVLAGLMEARKIADLTVTIDADLQDDVNAIDRMVDRYHEGWHIVCGVRDSRASDTFLKRFTARGYYTLMNLFGAKLVYDHADFRLLDKDALDKLALYHGYDLFLRGLITRLGFPVTTVPYDRTPRVAGESKYTLKKMLKLAKSGFSSAKYRPSDTPRPPDPAIQERITD